METSIRKTYEEPLTELFELAHEIVICVTSEGLNGRRPYEATDENPFGD